jgi:hypothetical protein
MALLKIAVCPEQTRWKCKDKPYSHNQLGYTSTAVLSQTVSVFQFQFKEQYMTQNYYDGANEADVLAKMIGLPYKVEVSPELMELLKPNEFLESLGIRYSERIKIILNSLKGSLVPEKTGMEEGMPKDGVIIPFAITKGPYIKEELVSIKAVLTDNSGEERITLTAVHEEN